MLVDRKPARAGFVVVVCLLTAACSGAAPTEVLVQGESDSRTGETGGKPIGESGHTSATPAVDDGSSSSATCTTKALPASGPTCERPVDVTSFDLSRATCWVDTAVMAGAKGTLQTPCTGDGEAVLTLGGMKFTGVIIGGKLAVCAGTEFDWSDGCAWTSAQRIEGDPSRGLVFHYSEAPKPKQSGCAPACTATASLRVQTTTRNDDPR